MKQNNEITVRIKGNIKDFYKLIEEKGFKIIDKFSMDDTYFIPANLNINNIETREILSKAVLIRDIRGKMSNRVTKKITFKVKNFDENRNILSQESINCDVFEIDDAKRLLTAIGYKEIMNIKEDDVVYEKNGFQFAVKDILNGDNLIEVETEDDESLDTIEKLVKRVDEEDIPIYKDDYFVEKAEIELNKILKR